MDAERDRGHAKDYIEAMWLMLQQDKPEDFVIATGESNTVRDFVNFSWAYFGKKIRWEGNGVEEKGYDSDSGKLIVSVDPRYFRPTEVETLLGDATKAKEKLGWTPKYELQDLVTEMMESDLKLMQKKQYLRDGGFAVKNYFE